MGCTGSSGFNPNVTYPGQTEQLIVIASELGMEKRDLNNLFKSYAKYDAVRIKLGGNNQAGEINMKDFFLLNQITSDDFAQHMSDTLFFNNKTGMVNFEEFVIIVWHLVTTSEKKLAAFAFKMFDTDNDNILEPLEVKTMMQTICGPDKKSYTRLHDAFTHIGKMHLSCTLAEFEHLVQENSTLLFPVFDMQLLLRDRTVGSRFLHLQDVKTQRFGPNKTLTEILSTLKHKPDCFVHRNDPKGMANKKKGSFSSKPTALSHPAPTPPTMSGHSHGSGKHSPGPHNEVKHKGEKTRKAHADGYHTPPRESFDNASRSSTHDPTKSDRNHHDELTKSNHSHSAHGHDSAIKSNHDHNKSGHDKDKDGHHGNKPMTQTKHTHDYIASHKTGKEFHDATEHHDLILHGKDEQKKNRDKEEEKKSTPHHYHDESHHDEREKHGKSKPAKPKGPGLETGWHADV